MNPKLEVNSTDDVVYIGENAVITVTVANVGNVDLKSVSFRVNFNETLNFKNISDGEWSVVDSVFMLNRVLKVNPSSSFNITLATTKVGNFTNGIFAGFGDVYVNTTSNVEVLNNSTPTNTTPANNTPTNTTPSNNTPVNNTPTSDEDDETSDEGSGTSDDDGDGETYITDELKQYSKNAKQTKRIDANETGNPLFLLLLVLFNIIVFRRGKR